jgi:hypothetical protein
VAEYVKTEMFMTLWLIFGMLVDYNRGFRSQRKTGREVERTGKREIAGRVIVRGHTYFLPCFGPWQRSLVR